jgi:poly(A) polymerase Pap1
MLITKGMAFVPVIKCKFTGFNIQGLFRKELVFTFIGTVMAMAALSEFLLSFKE